MNKVQALRQAIIKWERIIEEGDVDEGGKNCALCDLYFNPEKVRLLEDGNFCEGCPIKEKTGSRYCLETPYSNWKQHQIEEHSDYGIGGFVTTYRIECEECKGHAVDMLQFLKDLGKEYGI